MKSENAIGIAEAMYAMYEGQFKSLGGGGGRGPGPLLVSSAILRDRTESQGGLQYHTRPLASCGTGGAIQALRVPLKSLGGKMGSYGGLQYHASDYTDT